MARLLFSERPAGEVAALCGMSLRTFKHRMRKQGFSTFPSKGARSINRAIREIRERLGQLPPAADAADDGGARERLEGCLAGALGERARFLSEFFFKYTTRDAGLAVAPSESFFHLRKRLGKWRQKAQRRAVRQLVAGGLSAERPPALVPQGAPRGAGAAGGPPGGPPPLPGEA